MSQVQFFRVKDNKDSPNYWIPDTHLAFDDWYIFVKGMIEKCMKTLVARGKFEPFPLQIVIDFEGDALGYDDCYSLDLLVQKGLRKTKSLATEGDYHPRPILYIGKQKLTAESDYEHIENISHLSLKPQPNPRYRFWDSSIWHRYVSLFEINETLDERRFEAQLAEVLIELAQCHSMGLYRSTVAHEYLEFQLRLMDNAHYVDFTDGHAKNITPFRFRSEQRMKNEADKIKEELEEMGLQFRLLIIDDFANKELRKANQCKHLPPTHKKGDIIQKVLDVSFIDLEVVEEQDNGSSIIDIAEDVLTQRTVVFDLILLDYYLGKTKLEGPIYGHKLLERIKEKENLQHFANPLNRFWIFPISVHPSAFKSHLSSMGEENFSEFWYLSDGADPINCPQFFRYKLFRMMKIQVEMAQLVTFEGLVKCLKNIPQKAQGGNWEYKELKNEAVIIHAEYAQMLATHNRLSKLEDHSPFARSFIQYQKKAQNESMILLQQFIPYFERLAYGPQRHREEIQIQTLTIGSYLSMLDKQKQGPPKATINAIQDKFDAILTIIKK